MIEMTLSSRHRIIVAQVQANYLWCSNQSGVTELLGTRGPQYIERINVMPLAQHKANIGSAYILCLRSAWCSDMSHTSGTLTMDNVIVDLTLPLIHW